MGEKRKAEGGANGSNKAAKSETLVNQKRVKVLKDAERTNGPIVYWMSRDQRMRDNWALLYAIQHANAKGTRVAVCFNLVDKFLGAGARQFVFMLKGLQQMAPKLEAANIRFVLLNGDPADTVPQYVKDIGAGMLVTDQSPLRLGKEWRQAVADAVTCPFHMVDAHNVVPVWEASDKREYAARTIRRKIHSKLPEFLEQYPDIPDVPAWEDKAESIDWEQHIEAAREKGSEVPEVAVEAGEDAGWAALTGPNGFLTSKRLKQFDSGRNDPSNTQLSERARCPPVDCGRRAQLVKMRTGAGDIVALSGLSPYFHFGQLSPQRAALEAVKHKKVSKESVESFLEEAVVRRELSDNFCYYENDYDKLTAASEWARESLAAHEKDKREHVYSLKEFEQGKTHDDLWNAAQLEMVHLGKMHGFMRMYWAKKILEWTESPEQALEFAIYLNDKYELDGRDPNGYVGCMWSIAGIHDQGWKERDVFGKVRYMNYNGCKRKFDIGAYTSGVQKRIKAAQS